MSKSTKGNVNTDESDLSKITFPSDEFKFWADLSEQYQMKPEVIDRAAAFWEEFSQIKTPFIEIQTLNNKGIVHQEVMDLLETTQDVLDRIWKMSISPPYPESRMQNLFRIIGNTLLKYIQPMIDEVNIWKGEFFEIKDSLRKAQQISERWVSLTDTLTTQYWSGYERHKWIGGKFEHNSFLQLAKRLDDILGLRSVHDHVVRLLSESGDENLHAISNPFSAFNGIQPLEFNQDDESKWKLAIKEYDRIMSQLELKASVKLRKQFSALSSQPHQLLQEFQRYKDLITRPTIKNELSQEREVLLTQLIAYLSNINEDFDHRKNNNQTADTTNVKVPSGRNLPDVVNYIVWTRQLISKVEGISLTAKQILGDLPRFNLFTTQSSELLIDLKAHQKDYFEQWVSETIDHLEDKKNPISLQLSGKLMELDFEKGLLKVNFSERLVTLLREVRQLSALGFKIPDKISAACVDAQKFYRHGIVLKQVANFYNTINTEMISSQKGMLLDSAMAFEQVVKSNGGSKGQKGITWSNPADVEIFIDKLQKAAEKITTENRKLRKFHERIQEKVIQLMGIDLLRQQDKWKESIREIRGVIDSLEFQGYKNTRAWRTHWDHQIFKALEFQYRQGLEHLHENLPEIRVELVFKQQQLVFKPPIEQLRRDYYQQMKNFIRFPVLFKGVGDTDIFRHMTTRNASSLITVYQKAEELFQKLTKEKDQFSEWVILGTIDIDQYVDDHVADVADWELNFRMLKARGRDSEKLPSDRKIDCFLLSFLPTKATIDDHMQHLADSLVTSLRKSISSSITDLEKFVDESIIILQNRPKSLDDIEQSNSSFQNISDKKDALIIVYNKTEDKVRLLRTVGGGSATSVNFTSLQSKWENLKLTMESHEMMINEQKGSLKQSVEARQVSFNNELLKFTTRWSEVKPKQVAIQEKSVAQGTLQLLKDIRSEFEELKSVANKIVFDCKHFDMTPPLFIGLDSVEDDISSYERAWKCYEDFMQELSKLAEENWNSFRATKMFYFEDFVSAWIDNLRGRSRDPVILFLREELEKFRIITPILKNIRSDIFTQDDHWKTLFKLLDIPKQTPIAELTFGYFLKSSSLLQQKAQQVKDLAARAQGEVTIREALQELKIWGSDTVFTLIEHVEGKKVTPLIKEWKELLTQIGDNQSLLSSLKDSPYFKGFQDEAKQWENKLGLLDEYLQRLNVIQRRWLYLDPIFARGALPQEQPRFRKVDDQFREIMLGIGKDPKVISLTDIQGLRETLITLGDQLDRCQKALSDFLEEKRSKFPRFYFIGDDDLLEILGQSQNPTVIQTHLKKLFAGINSVDFSEDSKSIINMKSMQGEMVPLLSPVLVNTDQVESWLSELSNEMKKTLASLLRDCVNKVFDVTRFPSQILCLAEQIRFTQQCENAIQQNKLNGLASELRTQLQKYTNYDPGKDSVLQLKIKALILDIIHNMDVIEQLQRSRVENLESWVWQKQLRFYLDRASGECVVKMGEASFAYTYEYQGNAPKLVHTPLTDKCYLTLTQGINKGYGGNPYGPAGTGKTESVKALGQHLGRQVLVFNCDEGIDYKSMGRIFTGLVKCGAWGCFDEFNRLDEEVLSTVSQQIQIIQLALKDKSPTLTLIDKTIELDPAAGVFVTLNPAGKGYGGRSKLPDNLKQLFRSVAMSSPDLDLISEVILYSEGFTDARNLGKKLVSIFKLSRELLSRQQHYDWGLRALKTVLSVGGQLLNSQKQQNPGVEINIEEEKQILVKALKVNTLSKLTYSDSNNFLGLVSDVFPGNLGGDVHYPELEGHVRIVLTEMKLRHLDSQIHKILQFYENCKQRMGVVLVGPSGSSKSTIWKVLRQALGKMGKTIKTHTMNPKSMNRQILLGHMDLDTREWFDGILTASARQVVKEPQDVHSWVICDGDIDPEWVESLNSVLDDNRLLTLPNGERIQFGPNVNFIFETHDLKFASPATVSRMGMIFLSDEDMEIKVIVDTWLDTLSDEQKTRLTPWINELFYKAMDWVLNTSSSSNSKPSTPQTPTASHANNSNASLFVVETTKVGLARNGLSHLSKVTKKADFVLGLIRGIGGNLTIEKRTSLAKDVFLWANESPPDRRRPLHCYYDNATNSLRSYDFSLSPNNMILPEDLQNEPVIPTVEVQSNIDLFNMCIVNGEPLILVGPEGSGKSMLLRTCFEKLKSTQVATIHCSSQTTSQHIIQKLHQTCSVLSSTTGRVFRPKDSERLIIYLKDLNLPKPDKYETIQLIAFLQQIITYNGFFDENLEWMGLERIQIVGSMNPSTTVGRHPLSTRFTAIVRIFSLNYPEREQLKTIYFAYLQSILSRLSKSEWKNNENIEKLSAAMIDLYDDVRSKFPSDEHPHYLFTPRDLTKWCLGLLRYDLQTMELITVWVYEAQRLFRDRLVGLHPQRFDQIMGIILKKYWNTAIPSFSKKHFSTWAVADNNTTNAIVKNSRSIAIMSSDDFKNHASQGVISYEREFKDLRIHLSDEFLTHLSHVDRALSKAGGSLLLVGRPGSGRLATVTLAAHLSRMTVTTPNISRGYGIKAFKNDLKQVLQIAGVQGEPAVFVMEDHQFVEPVFIEYINSLLSAGEIPGLYSHEELDLLLTPLKDQLSQAGFFGGLFGFFVSRVKQNLHVVLLMDPTNKDFLLRCESNPALYTQCNLQWWEAASSESTMSIIAKSILGDFLKDLKNGEQIVKNLLQLHDSCSSLGATPQSFMTLLKSYKKVYESKKSTLEGRKDTLQGGLKKLGEAASTVDQLSQDAEKKRKLVTEKHQQANEAMEQITKALDAAATQREEMRQLREKLEGEEEKLTARKKEIEDKLSKVQPQLDEARAAVGNIDRRDLNEIKAFGHPPQTVVNVLEGVLLLLGVFDLSWQNMRSLLGQTQFLSQIMSFDAHNITPEIRTKVEGHLEAKKDSFVLENAKKASKAAAPLSVWVKANVQYSYALENIGPLEKEFAKASAVLTKFNSRVEKLQAQLAKVDSKVASLKSDYAERTSEALRLEEELKHATKILDSAQTLLSKLGSERSRWAKQVDEITQDLTMLPLATLLAAGFITYLSKTPENVRKESIEDWKKVIKLNESDSNWSFTRLMSTESELLSLKGEGLPGDSLSMENALVIMHGIQTPLIVDPTTQAAEWLKTHLKDTKLEVVNLQDPRFTNALELAVRFGKTLVIQEVDSIEPILYPILRRDLTKQGPRLVIQLGEKTIDFNEEFKLYLVSRNPHPEISPDSASLIVEVNFTVTRSGLEGQLLGATIQHEKPDLEIKKTKLLLQEEEQKMEMAKLEKQLLNELAGSEGNILENKSLLDSLNETKSKALIISQALTEAMELQRSLDQEREVYRPIASSGSELYFLLTDLQKVNNMYQFSLSSFTPLFHKALDIPNTPGNRITNICNALQKLIYEYVSRSLFKADRLMFGLHLVHIMFPQLFQDQEWEVFIGRVVSLSDNEVTNDFPTWASPDRKSAFAILQSNLPNLIKSLNLKTDLDDWVSWGRSPRCEVEFPGKMQRSVTPFQKLLLIQALRPDRLETAMSNFVSEAIGIKSLGGGSTNLTQVYSNDSTSTQPILMVVTPGADPSQELEELAEKTVGRQNYRQVAMGQGQENVALTSLRDASSQGLWLCLKNLHLATSWLPILEKELNTMKPHKNFRLWLTSEPHPKFSTILLQESLKLTYEAPPGLKKNLTRTFENWSTEFFSQGSVLRAQAFFVLAWFHAIVQERRKYIPQAWTKFYEFNPADLRAGAEIIDILSTKNRNGVIDWVTVQGLLEYAVYGGRVDNEFDFRVLHSYLAGFFHNDLLGQKTGQRKLARVVTLPQTNRYDDYMEVIKNLPESDTPDLFGLAANIERSIQRGNSSRIISQLKILEVSVSEGARFDRSEWAVQISPVIQLWQTLTQGQGEILLKGGVGTGRYDGNPVENFVNLERENARRLVQKVQTSLTALAKVISGSALLETKTHSLGSDILRGQVPSEWSDFWEGPSTPFNWLQGLVSKALALENWWLRVQDNALLRTGSVLNLGDLFSPDTFLNALRQQTARIAKCAIDELKLVCLWDHRLLSSSIHLPVQVEGLLLQGCSFDGNQLIEAASDAPELVIVPKCTFAWIINTEKDPYTIDNSVNVPLYSSTSRERLVSELSLPCSGERSKWILASVALFLGD